MERSALYFAVFLAIFVTSAIADHHMGNYNKSQNDESDDSDDDLYNPRDALLKYLLRRASPRVPPPPQYLPISVQVKLRPLSIKSVCPKTYHVKMPALEMYNWTDPRLTWNASDFGGIQYTDISPKDLWMPDIAIWQSPGSTPMQTRPKEYSAVVTADGNVLYIPMSELSIYCDAAPWKQYNQIHNKNNRNYGLSSHNSMLHDPDREHTQDQKQSEARQLRQNRDSNDWVGTDTFLCEFDQGPWIYDLSVVDVIPVSTGTPFHEHNETQSGEADEQEQPAQDEEHSSASSANDSQKSIRGVRRSNQQFPADDFDATADLSWFDGNELYDVASFTAERFMERYVSFPMDWASIHYRLLVKVNTKEVKRVYSGGADRDDDDNDSSSDKKKKAKKATSSPRGRTNNNNRQEQQQRARAQQQQRQEDTTDEEAD